MTKQRQVIAEEARNLFAPLIGEYVWFVRCGESRILRMEFGKPHLVVQGPINGSTSVDKPVNPALSRRVVVPTGQWSLFIDDGLWSVEAFDLKCSRFDPDQSEVDLCLSRLSGQKLITADVSQDIYSLNMKFDISGFLYVQFKPGSQESSQWILFSEDGWNMSYNSDGTIDIEQYDR